MLHKVFFSALVASVVGSCLLTGCETWFEKYYKPAPASYESLVAPPATPELWLSVDPVGERQQLEDEGYVLIGTSSFRGAVDSSWKQEAVEEGKKVGAAVVLLKVECKARANCPADWTRPEWFGFLGYDSFVASYWAKAGSPVK